MSVEEARDIAAAILSGELEIGAGATKLYYLAEKVTGDQYHPDFIAFMNLDDRISHMPVGNVRELWSEAGLARMDAEREKIVEQETSWVIDACQHIISVYRSENT
jgi:uncharacterized protein DUF2489